MCALIFIQEKYLFLKLATAAELTNHITMPRRDFFSTWQHNPALSSSVMTHISLSVSRRGGVQNDTLAWKILFEGTWWGLTEQPDWGEMSWYCHSARSFFVSAVGCGTVGVHSFSLSLNLETFSLHWPVNLSSCLLIWADQYWNLSSVLLNSVAVTHQGAVVQESGGEIAAEAERQDMSFSGAESHLVFWKG